MTLTHGHSPTGKGCGQRQSRASEGQRRQPRSGTKGREHRAVKERRAQLNQEPMEHHFFGGSRGNFT